MRWTLLAILVIAVAVLLSGCQLFGVKVPTLNSDQFTQLGKDMVAIEQIKDPQAIDKQIRIWGSDLKKQNDLPKKDAAKIGELNFRLGYLAEYRESVTQKTDPNLRNYTDATNYYTTAAGTSSGYSTQASYRLGVLGALNLMQQSKDASLKTAKRHLYQLTMKYDMQLWVRQPHPGPPPAEITLDEVAGIGGSVVLPTPDMPAPAGHPVLVAQNMARTTLQQLDAVYRTGGGWDASYYAAVRSIVEGSKGVGRSLGLSPLAALSFGVVLALFALAVIVKVVTAPLTTMAFRGMRDMQRIQPLLKELQEKYKDDKAKLAEEQMKLMKDHNVSPAGGCLPMLIQLPIFYIVYHAVQVYAFGFADAHFIWINNLAKPDVPLLVLYAISMIVTQKLTTAPAADPQQQAMQNQMTYMMPIFLVFVLMSFASAFVLYWFFLNVLSSAHQYYLMRRFKQEEAAKAAAIPATPVIERKVRRRQGSAELPGTESVVSEPDASDDGAGGGAIQSGQSAGKSRKKGKR